MPEKAFFIGIFLLFMPLLSEGQEPLMEEKKIRLITEIDSILQSQVDQDKIPGAVILVKKDTQNIYLHAYGYAQKYDYNHNQLHPPEK